MKKYKELWKQGLDKSEIFDRGIDDGENNIRLSKMLAKLPSRQASSKYRGLNVSLIVYSVLVWLLSFVASAHELLAMPLMPQLFGLLLISLLLLMLYGVYRRNATAYQMLMAFLVLGLLQNFAAAPVFAVLLFSPGIALCIFLKLKHYPHQELGGLLKNDDGSFVYE